eukprot:3692251-Amphidinium_carterae.1
MRPIESPIGSFHPTGPCGGKSPAWSQTRRFGRLPPIVISIVSNTVRRVLLVFVGSYYSCEETSVYSSAYASPTI